MTILWMNEPQSRKEEAMAHDPEGTIGLLLARIEALEERVKKEAEHVDNVERIFWEHGHYSDDSGVRGTRR